MGSLEEKNGHIHNKYRTIIEEFERKLDQQKEKEISVLEQLFRLRERFSYAQKVIKSPTMRTVLKIDELHVISKAVIESVVTDIKKIMEKETEEKYFGRGNEVAYQLFEMFLNNAELYAKHNESAAPQHKPFWQRMFNRQTSPPQMPPAKPV